MSEYIWDASVVKIKYPAVQHKAATEAVTKGSLWERLRCWSVDNEVKGGWSVDVGLQRSVDPLLASI